MFKNIKSLFTFFSKKTKQIFDMTYACGMCDYAYPSDCKFCQGTGILSICQYCGYNPCDCGDLDDWCGYCGSVECSGKCRPDYESDTDNYSDDGIENVCRYRSQQQSQDSDDDDNDDRRKQQLYDNDDECQWCGAPAYGPLCYNCWADYHDFWDEQEENNEELDAKILASVKEPRIKAKGFQRSVKHNPHPLDVEANIKNKIKRNGNSATDGRINGKRRNGCKNLNRTLGNFRLV